MYDDLNYMFYLDSFKIEHTFGIGGIKGTIISRISPIVVNGMITILFLIVGIAMADFVTEYFVSPTLLRVVRVFRVGRVLRLVKSAKGIRTLLFSLAVSMPALFNIGLLLFLVMFIYSIFGMSFFMHVQYSYGIDDMFNFETFGRSMIILFQISTSAGWDGALNGLMNEKNCNKHGTPDQPTGNCGNSGMAILFLVTYLVISFLVVINMYIAVILENFSQATEDVQQGITQDDFDMYYEVWEKFDEEATEFIPLDSLSEFADQLEEPLRLPAPNHFKLVELNIAICEDERVHCLDILDALTKNFLGTTTNEGTELKQHPDRKDYIAVSSTLIRQRELVCVKVVQKAWRNYVEKKKAQSHQEAADSAIEGNLSGEQPEEPKHTIVNIEGIPEESEEAETETGAEDDEDDEVKDIIKEEDQDTKSSQSSRSSKSKSSKEDKDKDKKEEDGDKKTKDKTSHDGSDDDSPPGGDDSRTVELYPDSGVVA